MSRFYPAIVAADALKRMGTDLEALAKRRRARETEKLADRFYDGTSAVFDSAEMQRMVQAGLDRLYRFQHEDWGWGWWHNDASSEYMTAYVLMGLVAAEKAGFKIQEDVIKYGYWHLASRVQKEPLRRPDEVATESWETQAFVAYVMSFDTRHKPDRLDGFMSNPSFTSIAGKHRAELVKHADRLGPYGKALLCLACANAGELEPAKSVLQSLLPSVSRDDHKGIAWEAPRASSIGAGGTATWRSLRGRFGLSFGSIQKMSWPRVSSSGSWKNVPAATSGAVRAIRH
jgi:alpha-2-macroglobulin